MASNHNEGATGAVPNTTIKPATSEQIDAACRIHDRLEQWRLSDSALHLLRHTMPGWNDEESLVKCVTINALYGTNVFAIVKMAKHVKSIFESLQCSTSDDLVEQIALLDLNDDTPPRRHVSFASKLCHFFVDEKRFPICDNAACETLRCHLGDEYLESGSDLYTAFQQNLSKLCTASNLTMTGREADRYLWIVGMYMRYEKWSRQGAMARPIVNAELLRVFEQRPIVEDLDALLPECIQRVV